MLPSFSQNHFFLKPLRSGQRRVLPLRSRIPSGRRESDLGGGRNPADVGHHRDAAATVCRHRKRTPLSGCIDSNHVHQGKKDSNLKCVIVENPWREGSCQIMYRGPLRMLLIVFL